MKKYIVIIIILFTGFNITYPQTKKDSVSKRIINTSKLYLIGGVTAGVFVCGYAVQNNLWWKGDKSKFHFTWRQDWIYALGEDKFGHFFFPYLVSNIYSQALEWADFDKEKSLWYSSSFALAYETFVEIRDGFSNQWGFSWGDFTADALGSAYPVFQNKIPVLKNFNFEISFYPSDRFKHGSNSVIFDDYESTYDLLSINVHNLLPENIRKFYPGFLILAIGHSVEKLDNMGGGNHRFYIGFDWNLEDLPGVGWFWNLLKRNLNYYHLPSPVIQVYPHVIWYGLKF